MKRIIDFWKWTKSIEFMIKLFFAIIFNSIGTKFNNAKIVKIAENILCKRPYVINTNFGSYLLDSIMTVFLVNENREPEIGEEIKNISKKYDSDGEKYMLNIGCNIGRWAIDCAKTYNYNVIAFEPAPDIYNSFIINIALSKLFNKVETYNIALGSDNSVMRFWYNKFINHGASHIITGKSKYDYDGGEIIDVPVKKFDDLGILDEKIDKTRLIVMDVEGFEFNVLQGMKKTLKKFHDINIIMEIWDDSKNKNFVIDFMKQLGYTVSQIDKDDWLFTK